MPSERVQRRLAAVLAADVAGYSRLMGRDEEGTLAQLKALRKMLLDPAIATHRGRIVKTTGDGIRVEFASAVDAARCSVEIQGGMVKQNSHVPQEQRIEFRIGIHVGDIIIDDNDIFGDGVNIAARLGGALAEPVHYFGLEVLGARPIGHFLAPRQTAAMPARKMKPAGQAAVSCVRQGIKFNSIIDCPVIHDPHMETD